MRRLAVVWVVAVVLFAAFLVIQKKSGVAAAAQQASPPPSASSATAGIASASKVSVLAGNVAVRSLAISPVDPSVLDFTSAAVPNQIFTLGSSVLSASPNPSVRIAAIAGTGTPGSLGDGGSATAAELDLSATSLFERSGIAIAPDGTTFVADSGNATIRAIAGPSSSEPGVIRSVAGRWVAGQSVALAEPMGIATDQAGNLYIADHAGSLDVLNIASGQLQTLAHIAAPSSVAVSRDGNFIFVASPESGAVFSVNIQTRAINAVAGFAPGNSSIGSVCVSSAQISSPPRVCPAGLAVDVAGNLFVSDANSGRILRVDAKTGAVSAVASGLNQPGEIALDANGNLYAADQGLNRIVAFAQVGSSQGSISLLPASASFANEPVGGSTATQSFTLSNTTATAVTGLKIPTATSPADFTVQSNNCATTLSANSNCSLNVAFTPTASGARSNTLTVTDSNASDSASTVLSGTGDDYELQLASGQQMQISIQAGLSATFNLQVVPDNTFSGAVSLVCPGNLPVNTTCTFSSRTLNVSPGTAVPFQVTFQTTGVINPLNTIAPHGPLKFPKSPRFPFFVGTWIATIFLALALLGSRRPAADLAYSPLRRAPPAFALFVLAAAILAGCSQTVTNAGLNPTPPGQTTMSITGNAQNASRAVSVTLVVLSQ